jgi:hypothetical protein
MARPISYRTRSPRVLWDSSSGGPTRRYQAWQEAAAAEFRSPSECPVRQRRARRAAK